MATLALATYKRQRSFRMCTITYDIYQRSNHPKPIVKDVGLFFSFFICIIFVWMIVFVFVYILKGLYLPFKKMVPKLPGARYVNNKIENIKDSTNQRIQSAKETAYRSGILLLTIGIIIWLAVFMYVVFYYTYIPPLTHTRPVHLQFK